jgi:hypothetical protein
MNSYKGFQKDYSLEQKTGGPDKVVLTKYGIYPSWDRGHKVFEGPFEWTRKKGLHAISCIDSGMPWEWSPPKEGFSISEQIEWKKFTLNLKHWYSVKERPMNPVDIYSRCFQEGPKFTEYLSDLKKYSLREAITNELKGDVEEDYPFIPITDLEDVFPPVNLFCWKLPDSRDFEYALEDPHTEVPEDVKKFKDKFRELLKLHGPVKLDEPTELDWLGKLTSSKVFYKGTKMYVWEARGKCSDENLHPFVKAEPDEFKFYAMPVQKNAFETRSAVACDLFTLNSVQYLDHLGKQVFEFFPGNKMSSKKLSSDFDHFKTKGKTFSMIDIKKCGLTFPHYLLKAMGEILQEEYPNARWDYLTGFHDAPLLWEGVSHSIKRGYNLGMANEYATACFITLFELWKEGQTEIEGWFFNDDQFLAYKSSFDSREILETWGAFLERYGIPVNWPKSLNSDMVIFCEMYGGKPIISTRKISQAIGTFLQCLHAHNIVHAKALANAAYNNLIAGFKGPRDEIDISFLDILKHWGCEFPTFYKEYYLPFKLGGWLTTWSSNLDTCLLELEELDGEKYKLASTLFGIKEPDFQFSMSKQRKRWLKSFTTDIIWDNLKALDLPDEWHPYKKLCKSTVQPKSATYFAVKRFWEEYAVKRQTKPKYHGILQLVNTG